MNDDYLWDRSGSPDPQIMRLEQTLRELRFDPSVCPLKTQSIVSQPKTARPSLRTFAAAASLLLAILSAVWFVAPMQHATWQVSALAGTPTIRSRQVQNDSPLPVGEWLETDTTARARIDITDVGRIEVEPGSRVELLSARAGNHRMRLVRGTVHALIWAPAGQFFVETPSSTAVDLGCAYTLRVDEHGNGLIEVTSGWVGFEWHGRESLIPSGSMCATRPGLGPGTPCYADVAESFRTSLASLDFAELSPEERTATLTHVLEQSREKDVVTLWHLLSRLKAGERDRVFDRLATFVPPPQGVTRAGIREGEREMLERWWDQLGLGSSELWRAWKREWSDDGGR